MSNQAQGYQNKGGAGTTALIVVLLLTTIAALVLATFAWAKYTETIGPAETTAVVAKWNVTGSSSNLGWTKTFDHVVASRLAPGTSGTIPVEFGINDTEVDVAYSITLVSATNKPTNLHFYTDSNKTTEIAVGGTAYSGTIAHNAQSKTVNSAIYWEWPYTTGDDNEAIASNDSIDTTDGRNAATMTVTIRMDAHQVQPQ